MSLLFGFRGPYGRLFLVARLVLVAAFLLVAFAFHPHGTTLDVIQGVRAVLLIALVGSGWLVRRSARRAAVEDSN